MEGYFYYIFKLSTKKMVDSRMASRTLDIYTSNIPLTQKARFWSDFVSSLKGKVFFKVFEF